MIIIRKDGPTSIAQFQHSQSATQQYSAARHFIQFTLLNISEPLNAWQVKLCGKTSTEKLGQIQTRQVY
jgi:hypothetical protein